MRDRISANGKINLVGALVVVLILVLAWPTVRTFATTSDRDSTYVMMTVPVRSQPEQVDAVCVLDLGNSQLKVAILDRTSGNFESFFYRDVGKDLPLAPNAAVQPQLTLVNGLNQIPLPNGQSIPSAVIYVGDSATGRIIAYTFPIQDPKAPRPVVAVELRKLDSFQWRQGAK
jgi:hypothetical protein